MRKRFIAAFAPALLGLVIVLMPVSVAAWNPFGGVDCSKAPDSAVCSQKPSDNPIAGPDGVIVKATNIIAIVAGIAAVFVIIIGAIKFVTSAGDTNSVSSAKNTILYALVGLVVIAVAKILITFVVSRI